jgi:predicted secreted protein
MVHFAGMRRFAAGLLVAIAPAAASAGDVATLNVLGFSNDGGVFAFEEFGVQDGSGYPYANRFYIDTATDSYMSGSPIRVRIDDESASLADARMQAQSEGEMIISDQELAENPGFAAGRNPVTEYSADPYRIVVNPRPVFPPVDAPMEIRLEPKLFPASETCAGISDTEQGFRLLSIDAAAGGTTEILHEDESVPASRGCPTEYRIAGIQTFIPHAGPASFAIILAIQSFGFEGPDFRYMAVTRRLEQ